MRELDELRDHAQALAMELRAQGVEVVEDAAHPNRLDVTAGEHWFVVALSPNPVGFRVFCTSSDDKVSIHDNGRCLPGFGLNCFPCNIRAEVKRNGGLDKFMKITAEKIAVALQSCAILWVTDNICCSTICKCCEVLPGCLGWALGRGSAGDSTTA